MDECMICGQTKAAHDSPEVHHYFSEHGDLRQKEKPKTGGGAVRVQPADALLRLITVLRSKDVLDKDDLDLIFGSSNAADRATPDHQDSPDRTEETPR